MINEYLYEIIVLIAILTLIVIYFLIKKFKQEDTNNFEQIKRELDTMSHKIKNNEENNTVESLKEENTNNETFILNEDQGSFGDIDNNPFEDKQTITNKKKPIRVKCEVPEHGKISKENFKEFAGVKLLIAEDNLINQKVISGLLSDSGIEITMANDGQITLEILEKNSDFNMILMDAHMPRVDGFEATRAIRANPNYEHIVVVALSGDTAADDVKKMKDSGMEEHLEKPLRMDALYDILYTYTKAKNNYKKNNILTTKELNEEKGLEICGGDKDFYIDILNEFKNNYFNSHQELYKLIENKNLIQADAMLLDLIGISANIGADNINKIAIDLKEAIKDLEEKSYVILIDQYEKQLNIILKNIDDYKNH